VKGLIFLCRGFFVHKIAESNCQKKIDSLQQCTNRKLLSGEPELFFLAINGAIKNTTICQNNKH